MIQKDTCTPMFTVALLTIANTWKQTKCPLTKEWIRKMGYRHSMKYCAVPISVTQLRLTLCDPVDYSSPGYPWDSPGKNTEVACHAFLTVEYHSAIKENETMPFAATWMDLEIIVLSEVSQTEKDKYHISLICGI